MSEMACSRSLSETLVAAASSFALFVAANWGSAFLLEEAEPLDDCCGFRLQGTLLQIFQHTTAAFGAPIRAFSASVENAMSVGAVKRRVVKMKKKMDHESIAIFTVCPIYIRFPATALTSDGLRNLLQRGYRSIDTTPEEYDSIEDMCPLEFRPIFSPAAAHQVLNANEAEAQDSIQSMTCLQLPGTSNYKDTRGEQEKALLLGLGFAPAQKHLRFVRSRNRFLSVVTALQACGYMLTVIQRAAQHLAISPVEAFVTFLCIIAGLQLLIEIYACGHYQCPLLLRLNAHQLHLLVHDAGATPPPHDEGSQRDVQTALLIFRAAIILLPWLLISGLSMYYFVHYVHAHFICSLSALFFFFAHAALLIPFTAETANYNIPDPIFITTICLYYVLYASSIILAVVSTIVDWKVFKEANQKAWYAWILPHVSS